MLSNKVKSITKKYAIGGTVKANGKKTNDAKKGGFFEGRSHAEGGIKAVNVDTEQPIEVEGNEVIINKKSVGDDTMHTFNGKKMTNREILSQINQSGGGVAFEKGGETKKMQDGGLMGTSKLEETAKSVARYKYFERNMQPDYTDTELSDKADKEIEEIATHLIGKAKERYEEDEMFKLQVNQGGDKGINSMYMYMERYADDYIDEIDNDDFEKGGEMPNDGEVIDINDIDYDMMDFFSRTNKKLLVTMNDGEKIKSSVGKFYNDLIFFGDFPKNIQHSDYSIQKKSFKKVQIIEDDFERGGKLKYYDKENEYRLGRPSGSIEKEILEKVTFKESTREKNFVGNFGWKTPQGKLGDGYLYSLDEYDQNLVKDLKLKDGEKIFRYLSRTTAIGGMTPMIKINLDKELIYFLIHNENDEIVFETKGTPALWIGLIQHKMEKGGSIDADRYAKPMGWRWKDSAVEDGIISKAALSKSPSPKLRKVYPEYVYYEDRTDKSDKVPSRKYQSLEEGGELNKYSQISSDVYKKGGTIKDYELNPTEMHILSKLGKSTFNKCEISGKKIKDISGIESIGIVYTVPSKHSGCYDVRLTDFGVELVKDAKLDYDHSKFEKGGEMDCGCQHSKYKDGGTTEEKKYFQGIDAKYKNQFEVNKAIEEFIESKDVSELSPAERAFIGYYAGYGGLEKFGATGKGLLYEYFTPSEIAKKMWGLAYKHGYKGGKLLEPSCGIGEFIKYAPSQDLVTGYEINKISAKICKVLYPNAKIESKYFETLFIKDNNTVKNKISNLQKYSLVIGNPPYGKMGGIYAGMGEQSYTKASNYIDYFIYRGLDLLEKDGLLIYIIGTEVAVGGTPFLQQPMTPIKKMIAEKSILLDAYRLPNGLFETTDVLTDIIVLKKK